MGWKNVKEHYRIGHFVTVKDEWDDFNRKPTGNKLLCIGSPLCHDLITVNLATWKFGKALGGALGGDLQRYWDEMHADFDRLRELISSPDTFEKSILVYTYDGGDIVEKFCEEPGWPNVTHDGDMMYENTFSTDRDYIIDEARRDAEARIKLGQDGLDRLEKQLAEQKTWLEQARADLEKLNAMRVGNTVAATDERETLELKWGTLKGWDLKSQKALDALNRYAEFGTALSAMSHRDTPEQKQALCDLIDAVDGDIWNDWDGEIMTKEAAKKYVMEYRT